MWEVHLMRGETPVLIQPLSGPSFTIGRSRENSLCLPDSDISRKHCRIEPRGESLLFTNESRNGTLVNGMITHQHLLTFDDKITIGHWTLLVKRGATHKMDETVIPFVSSTRWRMGRMIGKSKAMTDVFCAIDRAASTSATVLIEGESGTGKEIAARLIHERGLYPDGPFVPINCGAIPATMIEAMLFGHERGSFTGATEQRPGAFELAHGGTLFLDEIGEMPLELQSRLLRILEDGRVRRIGGKDEISVQVRTIAATNKNLTSLVSQKLFREDLFYRLYVIPITLPPLATRPEDIELLSQAFLETLSCQKPAPTLSPAAVELLRNHSWPGNVRELKNTMERTLLFTAGKSVLDASDILLGIFEDIASKRRDLLGIEHQTILETLKRYRGNMTRVAEELGIARTTLAAKMRRLKIQARQFR